MAVVENTMKTKLEAGAHGTLARTTVFETVEPSLAQLAPHD